MGSTAQHMALGNTTIPESRYQERIQCFTRCRDDDLKKMEILVSWAHSELLAAGIFLFSFFCFSVWLVRWLVVWFLPLRDT